MIKNNENNENLKKNVTLLKIFFIFPVLILNRSN